MQPCRFHVLTVRAVIDRGVAACAVATTSGTTTITTTVIRVPARD